MSLFLINEMKHQTYSSSAIALWIMLASKKCQFFIMPTGKVARSAAEGASWPAGWMVGCTHTKSLDTAVRQLPFCAQWPGFPYIIPMLSRNWGKPWSSWRTLRLSPPASFAGLRDTIPVLTGHGFDAYHAGALPGLSGAGVSMPICWWVQFTRFFKHFCVKVLFASLPDCPA